MLLARSAGQGFFPLDEELALLPGSLTPSLQEALVRLGARLPLLVARAARAMDNPAATETTVEQANDAQRTAFSPRGSLPGTGANVLGPEGREVARL